VLALFTSPSLAQSPAPIRGTLEDFDLDAYRGQLVVVLPLSGWCVSCFEKLPELSALAQRYAEQGVQFVGILNQSAPDWSATLVERFGVTYPVYLDTPGRATVERFGAEVVPSAMLVYNAEGELVENLGRFDLPRLEGALDNLL
jgi:thiol-disulfide isomerase/thioredoxin